jgi:hypothetical protein
MEDADHFNVLLQEALQTSYEIYCNFLESAFFTSFPGLEKEEIMLKHYLHTLSCFAAQQAEGEPLAPGMAERILETIQAFRPCAQDILNLLQEVQSAFSRKEEAFATYGKISKWSV